VVKVNQEQDPREIALEKFILIAPLLEPGIDKAELQFRRQKIVSDYGRTHFGAISERTIRRYLENYRKEGFQGLYPKQREDAGKPRVLTEDIMDAAAILKQELPQRSIRQIIEILEGEGRVKSGQLKPATVARHIVRLGLMKLPKEPAKGMRRFRKEYRNQLWQADLKYGPYLPDPKNPKKGIRTYLLAFIDDYSRLVPHAEFYLEQRLPALEDCLKKAILKRGIPNGIFVDNGKIFISRWLRIACARLNIRHLTAAPYAPESKGKIERFMGRVEEFLAEAEFLSPKTLKELNEAFWGWLEEAYNHKPHSALDAPYTPASVFAADSKPVRYATAEELREAFLWEEDRKVDKTGCIKYNSRTYDVGPDLIGQTIEIRFDPFADAELEVWINGRKDRIARELVLNQPRSKGTENTVQDKPARSRYLDLLTEKEKQRRQKKLGAISFRELGGGGDV
jgi:putative transposase